MQLLAPSASAAVFTFLLGGAFALAPALGNAQVFKCEVGGKIVYQQQACQGAATSVQLANKAPANPNLWTDLKAGMTVGEVKRLVPQAQTGNSDTLRNGAKALLTVAPVSVVGLDFSPNFFFLGDKFHRVNFSGPMGNDNASNKRAFDKLVDTLRQRYGSPATHEVKDTPAGLSARADWQIAAGEVWLVVVPVGPQRSLFNFGYLPKQS
ncbi:hypothetical protein ACFIQF_01050 [Comamonas sp. J-3]|uniref:hypothetical protein n=1 Tax=Comamonas trifloxystrobinivorans TaxID=3350256 RepID=UPI003729D165